MSPSHRHTSPQPARLDHFTECGEPLTMIAGIVLERAMTGPHPAVMDTAYLEQQVERCRADHLARDGRAVTRGEVLAATREAIALEQIPPSQQSQAFAAGIAALA